jgi:alpha-tubulin suppressor-like RCC1 family protein
MDWQKEFPMRWQAASWTGILGILLACAPAKASVVITGTVKYQDFSSKEPGGGYLGAWTPAKQTKVNVVFHGAALVDQETWTDDQGRYRVSVRNPVSDSFSVTVEVYAAARLRAGTLNDTTVTCWKGHTSVDPYYCWANRVAAGADETVTVDVNIGVRRGNAQHPDDDRDGKRVVAGIDLCQTILRAYRWLVDRCPTGDDLERDLDLFYDSDRSTQYDPTPFVYPLQWGNDAKIDVKKRDKLYPDDTWGDLKPETAVPEAWRTLRAAVTHEYGHKVMHDVYAWWPDDWGDRRSHGIDSCVSARLGWLEGWADFLPAAVLGRPNLEGLSEGKNLEYNWHPPVKPYTEADQLTGDIFWRSTLEKPDCRHWNEGEVAAALMDIFDDWNWEFMNSDQQDARPAGYPYLKWLEKLSDSKLDLIWPIIRDDEPRCFVSTDPSDENDFWHYWNKKYKDDLEKVHRLKAILANRGMPTTGRPENAPRDLTVEWLPLRHEDRLVVKVTEPDAEDRPFLLYNVAYGTDTGDLKLLFDYDEELKGRSDGQTVQAMIAAPPRTGWTRAFVCVHDNMQAVFAAVPAAPATGSAAMGPLVAIDMHALLRTADESVRAWGWNFQAALGDGTSDPNGARYVLDPVRSKITEVRALAASNARSAAIRKDGTFWWWGVDRVGMGSKEPLRVEEIAGATDLALSGTHTLVLARDTEGARVLAWGWGQSGQLGDGQERSSKTPVAVAGLPRTIVAVAAGGTHSLALDANGDVWAWGSNTVRQLGDGTDTPKRLTPVKLARPADLAAGANFIAIAAGNYHSLALASDGSVYAWGLNESRQATGGDKHCRVPTRVWGIQGIIAVRAGGHHSLALHASGYVYAWGRNDVGQLGDGTEANRSWPGLVKDISRVIDIAAGQVDSMALCADGTLWGWGWNEKGALGLKARSKTAVPVRVERANFFQ